MESLSLHDLVDQLDKDLEDYNEKINFLSENRDKYTKEEWEKVAEEYEFDEDEVNKLIVRKEDLGKKNGLDFLVLMYNQKFSEEFYNQSYIKELLNMSEDEYHEIMGRYNSLETCGYLWQNLFYINQWEFSEKFLIENVENFIYTYHFQRYQNVPISIYEKYIDDEKFEHVNAYDQEIPAWFIHKHMKKHANKFHINNFSKVEGLTEDMFLEFLTYDYFKDESNNKDLWNCIGYFNPSEEFLKNNIDRINVKEKRYNPWVNILSSDNNKVKYSINFIEENLDFFNINLLFNGKIDLSEEIIKKHHPKSKSDFDDSDFLSLKELNNMPELIEDMISKNIISFNKLEKGEYVPLELIEKYHDKLDMDYVLYFNKNITIDFLKNKVLIWYPEIEIDVSSYIRVENCGQKNVEYFINEFYKRYDEEDITMYYNTVKKLVENYEDRYSDEIRKIINNKEDIEYNNNTKGIASFDDPGVVFRFIMRDLHERISDESN